MRITRTLALCAAILGLLAGSVLTASETTNLFDGKSLKGWTGNPDHWSVQDGVIVGSTMEKKTPKNTFLILEKT